MGPWPAHLTQSIQLLRHGLVSDLCAALCVGDYHGCWYLLHEETAGSLNNAVQIKGLLCRQFQLCPWL